MILSVEGITFRYPESERDALKDVSFTAEKGEYIAVLGSNGSGKSTLLRCIAGLAVSTSGAVRLFTESAEGKKKAKGGARSVPTAVVFQTPDDQIVAETVELDAAFGPENLCLPRKEMRGRVDDALALFLADTQKDAPTAELSTGQKQRLALAGAHALNSCIILLDEPASMISEKDRDALLDFLDGACREGKTIFHVTHSIEEALRASRVLVLNRGTLAFDGARDEFRKLSDDTLAEWSLIYKEKSSNIIEENVNQHLNQDDKEDAAQPLLACSNLEAGPFCNVSIKLRRGEITAVTGESGSGKSLLLLCLAKIAAPKSGEVTLREGSKSALAVQESEAALFEEFVADDVAFAPEEAGISGEELKAVVREAMDAAGLPFEKFADRKTFSLSGGEKRKAAIAGIIATGADVLLFDEPFSALDAKGRGEAIELLRRLAKSGKAVMFTANRQADCEGLADRVICLDNVQKPQPQASAAHRNSKDAPAPLFATMPPVAKFLCCALAVAATLLIKHPLPLCIFTLFIFITARQAGLSLSKLFKAAFRILPWLLIIMAIQCFYLKSASLAAIFFLRFLCLLAELSLFIFVTPPTEISCGAEDILFLLRIFRVPVRNIALLISLVFRFFPTLYSEAEKLKIARRVRIGAAEASAGKKKQKGKIRETAALIVPIVTRTLAKAEKLSLAISARYYTSGKHTRLLKWKLRPSHAAFIILSAVFSALLVWVSLALM